MTPDSQSSPKLKQIIVAPVNPQILKGTNIQLSATGVFDDGVHRALPGAPTWQSSQPAIATVTPEGNVAGVGVGVAQISAGYQGMTGETPVNVLVPALLNITVSPSQATLPVGLSEQLTATGNFSDGSVQNLTQSATWTSPGSAVASVSASGYAVANAVGTVSITASYGSMKGSASLTVSPPTVIALNILPASLAISVGTSRQLQAIASLSNGAAPDVTGNAAWGSSQSGIATVTQQGTMTAVGKGASLLSATYKGLTATADVAVGPAALLSINVTPNSSSLPLGESENLIATGTYSDGSMQTLTQSATWASISSAVATVNAQGSVTGMGKGATQVSAAYQGMSGSASVDVGPPALLSITVTPNPSSLPLGESEQLSATGNYSDGSIQNLTQTATWTLHGSASATMNSPGSLTTSTVGTAAVSATFGSVSGSATLTVTPPIVTAVNISPATLTLVLGGSGQFHAMATWSNGTTQDMTSDAGWSSTPPNIASISSTGTVTASQVGSTTILAQVNSATGNSVTGSANLVVMPLALVSYYSRINAATSGIDGTVRVSNPGLTLGNVCAMVYVFDQNEELNECCGCSISDSGLLTLSVLNNLTANTLTGNKPRAGEIKIVPSDPTQNPQCNPNSLSPTSELVAWGTNPQPAGSGRYQLTETAFDTVPLTSSEASLLQNECGYAQQLGSGAGVCSCGSGN